MISVRAAVGVHAYDSGGTAALVADDAQQLGEDSLRFQYR